MPWSKPDPVVIFADNIRHLMKVRGDSQLRLAQRAGVSQRVVGDLMTYGKGHFKNPTVRTLDALAGAYGVAPWVLLLPDMPLDNAVQDRVLSALAGYLALSERDRESVDRLLDAFARSSK